MIKDKTNSRLFLLALLLLFSLSVPSLASSADKVDVTDIRFWSYPDYTRVAVSLSDKVEFTKKRLSNPDRLYFDLKNCRVNNELKTALPVGNGMLRSVRAGQFDNNTVRVVLDLEKIKNYEIINMEDPIRLIIDIYGQESVSSKGLPSSLKKRIVIDPGHGGHDPGAVGPNRLYEKDVVLDIGLKLRKILSEDPNIEVFMTRDRDVFIPLEERTAIANSRKADLFVSVHANASPRRDARGIETYFLNWTDDEESMKVAARENQISLRKMRKMQEERSVLDVMLSDLSRGNKRDESLKLAGNIQKAMVSDLAREYKHITDHGIKWAPFYVLFGAHMPSVLVEVSFISNPVEEKLLAREDYRGDLAKSIASGISKYMTSSPEIQNIAGIGK